MFLKNTGSSFVGWGMPKIGGIVVLFLMAAVPLPAIAQQYNSSFDTSYATENPEDRNPKTRYLQQRQAEAENPLRRSMQKSGAYAAANQANGAGQNASPLYRASNQASQNNISNNLTVSYAAPSKSSLAYANQLREQPRYAPQPSALQKAATVARVTADTVPQPSITVPSVPEVTVSTPRPIVPDSVNIVPQLQAVPQADAPVRNHFVAPQLDQRVQQDVVAPSIPAVVPLVSQPVVIEAAPRPVRLPAAAEGAANLSAGMSAVAE